MTNASALTFVSQLKTTEVRLLARSVFAPPLLSLLSIKNAANTADMDTWQSIINNYRAGTIFTLDKGYKDWLTGLDAQPEELQQHIASSPKKLGLYHENLWAYFLRNSGRTLLLAQNLKVRMDNRDIGELDFIYQHEDYGIIHLELACKYYLASKANSVDWEFWLGPNRSDSLDRKINHSINHQLPLSSNHLAKKTIKQCFEDKNIPTPDTMTKQLHIGGRLFYRLGENCASNAPILLPHLFSSSHLRGLWLTHNQWCNILKQNDDMSAIPVKKPAWLDSSENLLTTHKTDHHKLSTFGMQTPSLLACKSTRLNAGFVFIVPNNWNEAGG
jgi:hypothetical protein